MAGLSKEERKNLGQVASEDTEIRRLDAEKKSKNKKVVKHGIGWTLVLIILGLIAYAVAANAGGPGKYDSFAQCLTEKDFVEYGAYWCSNCAEQKQKFGKSFKYVTYVECDPNGRNADPGRCALEGIEGYPTWIGPNDERLAGTQTLETLSRISGCPL